MNRKSDKEQNIIILAIKRIEKSLRAEFKKTEKNLRGEILKVEERVENLEEGQKRIEATINRTASTLDGFVGAVDDLRVDNTVGTNQIHELDKTTKNHEARITKLESPN